MYNKEQYIKNTIETVIRNHGVADDEFECILVNESSTDNSGRICMEYAEQYPYIDYYGIQNDGEPRASNPRNFGKTIAKGKYVMFLDADDELLSGWQVNVLDWLDEHPEIDVWVGNYLIDDKPTIPETSIWDTIGPSCSCCIYRNDVVKAVDFDNVPCEDVTFSKKLMLMGYRFHQDDSNPFIFRWCQEGSTNNSIDAKILNEYNIWTCGPASILQYDDRYDFFITDAKKLSPKWDKRINHIDIACNNVSEVQQMMLRCKGLRDQIRTIVLDNVTVNAAELGCILDVVRYTFPNNEIKLIFGDNMMDDTYGAARSIVKNNVMCVFRFPVDATFKKLIENIIPKYFLRYE